MYAIRFKTGDGKVLYTKTVDGPFVAKLAPQIERRHQGIREMEMIQMPDSDFYSLKVDQLAILEL